MRITLLSIIGVFYATTILSAQSNTIRVDSSETSLQLSFTVGAETIGPVNFGAPVDWGTDVDSPVDAELAWGFTTPSATTASDSLGCSTIQTDLTGKFAVLRRGNCAFSAKAANAEAAGAIGFVIVDSLTEGGGNFTPDMQADDLPSPIGIPGIFISYNTGLQILPGIDAGQTASLSLQPVANVLDYYLSQFAVIPLSQGRGIFGGPLAGDTTIADGSPVVVYSNVAGNANEFTATLSVTDPEQVTSVLGTTTDDIAPGAPEFLVFDADPVTYDQVGTYKFSVSTTLENQVADTGTVVVSPNFFQTVPAIQPIGITTGQETYVNESNSEIRFGMVVDIASDVNAQSVSFGLCNAPALIDEATGAGPVITAVIIDPDIDNDGISDVDSFGSVSSFSPANEIANGEYILTGNEICSEGGDNLLDISLVSSLDLDSVRLEAGKLYVVAIRIQSGNEGTGLEPQLQGSDIGKGSQIFTYPFGRGYVNTFLETNRKYSGFAGITLVARLTVSDTGGPVATSQLSQLAGNFKLYPNPANGSTSLRYILSHAPQKIDYLIVNAQGQILRAANLPLGQTGTVDLSTADLPSGLYSIIVKSSNGIKALRLVVEH